MDVFRFRRIEKQENIIRSKSADYFTPESGTFEKGRVIYETDVKALNTAETMKIAAPV